MSCLPIVSDRAATEGSKYLELGRQPHEFLTRNTCYIMMQSVGEKPSAYDFMIKWPPADGWGLGTRLPLSC